MITGIYGWFSDFSGEIFDKFITHSSEATYINGKPTQALKDLNEFIFMAKKHEGVEFVTLKEAYELLS